MCSHSKVSGFTVRVGLLLIIIRCSLSKTKTKFTSFPRLFPNLILIQRLHASFVMFLNCGTQFWTWLEINPVEMAVSFVFSEQVFFPILINSSRAHKATWWSHYRSECSVTGNCMSFIWEICNLFKLNSVKSQRECLLYFRLLMNIQTQSYRILFLKRKM